MKQYSQQQLLTDLVRWLRDLEIVVEPQRVQTTDGYVLERQPDGSYSDGDLSFESLGELGDENDWEEVA